MKKQKAGYMVPSMVNIVDGKIVIRTNEDKSVFSEKKTICECLNALKRINNIACFLRDHLFLSYHLI